MYNDREATIVWRKIRATVKTEGAPTLRAPFLLCPFNKYVYISDSIYNLYSKYVATYTVYVKTFEGENFRGFRGF